MMRALAASLERQQLSPESRGVLPPPPPYAGFEESAEAAAGPLDPWAQPEPVAQPAAPFNHGHDAFRNSPFDGMFAGAPAAADSKDKYGSGRR